MREPGWHPACMVNVSKQAFGSVLKEVRSVAHLIQILNWICDRRMESILEQIQKTMPQNSCVFRCEKAYFCFSVVSEMSTFRYLIEIFIRTGAYGPQSFDVLTWLMNHWSTTKNDKTYFEHNVMKVVDLIKDKFGTPTIPNPFAAVYVIEKKQKVQQLFAFLICVLCCSRVKRPVSNPAGNNSAVRPGFSRRGRGNWSFRGRRGGNSRNRGGGSSRPLPVIAGRVLTDYCRGWNEQGACVWEHTAKGCQKLHACNLCGSEKHPARNHGTSADVGNTTT